MVPEVSVVVPTKNRATLVSLALGSILKQTFGDFEILVIDGASRDNTREVVEQFIDERISYIHQDRDQGVSSARNLGINLSKGKYIAFLDDDDLWLPQKLQKQLEILRRKPHIQVVYSVAIEIRKRGKTIGVSHPSAKGNIFSKVLEKNCVGNCSGIIVKKSCFIKTGLFDENLPAAEDWDMWIRLARHFEFDFVDEPLFIYRIHEARITENAVAKLRAQKILFEKFSNDLKRYEKTRLLGHWYYSLGKIYCECRDFGDGRKAFKRALEFNPKMMLCYFRMLATFFGSRVYAVLRASADSVLPISYKKKFD